MSKHTNLSTVADILIYYGKDVSYYRGGFFRSPFRDESTPSFHISNDCRMWYDHGLGTGGGVIELIMLLENTSDRKIAYRKLLEIEGNGRVADISEINSMVRKENGSHFDIVEVRPFTSFRLIHYAISRGISYNVLSRYCNEVVVSPSGNPEHKYTYIGFKNNKGGYVLRNTHLKHGKKCTDSYPTFLSEDGTLCNEPSSERVILFEGFFDFLSFIVGGSAHGVIDSETLNPGCDVCILNSVSNRAMAKDFVLKHNIVDMFLDNDQAGADTVRYFMEQASKMEHTVEVNDMSQSYKDVNDVNEFLVKYGDSPM